MKWINIFIILCCMLGAIISLESYLPSAMQIPLNKKRKGEHNQEGLEERIVSLIASLFGKECRLSAWGDVHCGILMP